MPKAQKGEHGSVVIRYGLLLFTVIVLFAGIMSFILLRFAAERFERYEVQTVQSGMQLAADDLENQCESLNEIASKIRVTSYYQPSIVCLDAYREIELLEDFVYFRNFSPVIDKYFLLYPEEGDGRQKIYISDGRVAYFSYYAEAAFGIREEETALLLRHLLDLRTQECLMIGDTVLLITPVRFVETQGPDSRALAVFLLPIKRLNARMHQMAASLPAQVQVATQTMPLASFTANGVETLPFLGDAIPEGQRFIEVTSSDGKLKLSCPFADDKWSLLHSSLPKWVFAGIGLCLVVVAAVSAILARRMAKPLLDFIHRHMPPGERFRNEQSSWLSQCNTVAERPERVNYYWQIRSMKDTDMPMTLQTGVPLEAWDQVIESSCEYYDADTIEELAGLIDVDPAVLTATVDRYNELCEKGVDEDWGKNPKFMHPVLEPPFRAAKATCFFFCTSSGVRCNGKLQVCDKDWQPIPHLFAAGNNVGWRLGCGYQMTVPGMCNAFALFHGYEAGRYAADPDFTWDQLEA